MERRDCELDGLLAETRRALKGLQRQARQTLQLASALEERLAAHTTIPAPRTASGGQANDRTENTQPQNRFAGSRSV